MSALLLLEPLGILAQSPVSEKAAQEAYTTARSRFQAAPSSAVAAWQVGRAAFDLADLTPDEHQASALAEEGVNVCRQAVSLDANSVAAHYYLALNLGELARSKKLGALKILREMEQELLTAYQLDPDFDYAGSDRSLGMLYLEAPGWPLSIGNRNKARARLEAAVARSSDFPDNQICLAEAYLRWGEARNLEHSLQILNQMQPKARARFSLPAWTTAWKDWEARLRNLNSGLEKLAAHPPLSPAERGAKGLK